MALLRARRSGATASLRACANTAEPTKAHSQEVKDHSAAPPKNTKPTHPPHPRTPPPPTATRPAPPAPTGGTAPAGRGQAKALKPGLPTPPQTRGGRHQSRPSDEPPRLWRSHPHLDTGRILATAKVPSGSVAKCDAPANEFSDFKASGTAHDFP